MKCTDCQTVCMYQGREMDICIEYEKPPQTTAPPLRGADYPGLIAKLDAIKSLTSALAVISPTKENQPYRQGILESMTQISEAIAKDCVPLIGLAHPDSQNDSGKKSGGGDVEQICLFCKHWTCGERERRIEDPGVLCPLRCSAMPDELDCVCRSESKEGKVMLTAAGQAFFSFDYGCSHWEYWAESEESEEV